LANQKTLPKCVSRDNIIKYVIICISMLPNKMMFSKQNQGRKNVVCARVDGANTAPILAAGRLHWGVCWKWILIF
jgi:hypothetical protein